MAVPFDVKTMEPAGTPVEVLKEIRTQFNGVGAFSCSDSGNCVYGAGATVAQRRIMMVDRSGTARALPLPPKAYAHPRFSSSGNRLSYWIEQARCDVEVTDLVRGTTIRLTSEGDNHFPVWMPNGERIAYISRKRGAPLYELFSRPASGGGAEETMNPRVQNLTALTPLSWSPNGTLAFSDGQDLWVTHGSHEPRRFSLSRFVETTPAFSPDGRWLAYISDESGRFDVYVQPSSGGGEKYPISASGGVEPVWGRDGKELFYRSSDQVMAVAVDTRQSFSASRPRLLFSGPYARSQDRINYDVAPDGQNFVMLSAGAGDQPLTQVNLLVNWFEELKRLVPVN